MKLIRSYYIVISISLFILFLIVAEILAPKEYSFSKHAISILGAQGYDRKIIMQLGFISFGVILATATILNGLSWRSTPILIYALSMTLIGIFCQKPFFNPEGVPYSETQSTLHSLISKLAAISFGIGVLIQLLFSTGSKLKLIQLAFLILLIIIGGSLASGLLKSNQGLAQRLLFLISFTWLIKFYK